MHLHCTQRRGMRRHVIKPRASLTDEVGAREQRAAGRDEVVDQQHALPLLDRARVDLDLVG